MEDNTERFEAIVGHKPRPGLALTAAIAVLKFPTVGVPEGSGSRLYFFVNDRPADDPSQQDRDMKVVNSLKTAKTRHRECKIVRRKGRVYVINKQNPRFKARQG